MSETDPITEKACGFCSATLHKRINERPTLKIVLIGFLAITGLISYVYTGQAKIEDRQWQFTEKMVTQEDFREFKKENNAQLARILLSIEKIGK